MPIVALSALSGYATYAIPVFRDSLQAHFGISLAQFGFILSIGTLPAAAGTFFSGILVDRLGPIRVLRAALVGTAAGMAFMALGWSWGLMLAAVCVVTCFAQTLAVTVPAYLAQVFPAHQRRAFSFMLAAVGLVGMIYPLLVEFLLHLHKTHPSISFASILHGPFAVLAVLFLVAAVSFKGQALLDRAPGPTPPDAATATRLGWRTLSASTLVLIGLLTLHGIADCAIFMWIPRVLESGSFPVKTFVPGVVLAGYSCAYLVSRGILSILPEHKGARLLMVAPGLLGGTAFLVGLLSRNQAALSVAYVVAAFLWSLEFPAILAMAARRAPGHFGAIIAISGIITSLGTFLIGTWMGAMGEVVGENRLWLILIPPACLFPAVGLGGAWWLSRFLPHDAAEQHA